MHCHLCGHRIGAWNTDPYKINGKPVCDRCWNSGADQLAEKRNREKLTAQQREPEKGVRRDERADSAGAAT